MPYSDNDETRPDSITGPDTDETRVGTPIPDAHAPLPETIGKYRILSLIGEGGMGSVYKAEQDSPRRTVALKVIKAGVASSRLLHRFEIEAQILGKLDHPGIAKIYEAGTFGEGQRAQPYFAMEFIEGQELLDYVEPRKLGTRERLKLLAKIAQAVQHAHQKGVIHRDLKPGNILVNKEGQVKILDFGVARATDADIQTATMQTDIGQLIGTLPYMSPEQASGNPDDLDTRSDVYALGVIAYELLTGEMPYDLRQKMIHEAVRVIQYDEPKTLSTINRTFRGDVEIIVGKALIKEKDRRYQSASDLASDIERYLNNEPIEARPPSTWYQLSKFSKRNKALVVGVAAVLIVSVAGALVSINFARGEAAQKQLALDAAEESRIAKEAAELSQAEEAKRAEELELVADFQSEQLSAIEPEVMGGNLRRTLIDMTPVKQRDALVELIAPVNFTNFALTTLEDNIFNRTIGAIDKQFENQPVVRARLLQTVANTLRELGLVDLAVDPQERALVIRRDNLGDEHEDTIGSINNLGHLLVDLGQLDESELYFREALQASRRTFGDEHPDTLNIANNLGNLFSEQGRFDEAEPILLDVLETQRRVLGDEHPDTLNSINNMGALLRYQNQLDEAEAYLLQSLNIRRRVLGNDHTETLTSINNMGGLLLSQGKLEEAEPYYREALQASRRVLGDDHPDTLNSINNLAVLLRSQGRIEEAEPYFREALDSGRRVLGNEHPSTLIGLNNMGSLLSSQGRLEEAELYFLESLQGIRRILGRDHPRALALTGNMGALLWSQGRLGEAELYYRDQLDGYRRVLGNEHPSTLESIQYIGSLLSAQGKPADAERYNRELLEGYRLKESEPGAQVASALVRLGTNLIKQGRYADAQPILSECLEIRRRVMSEGHWLIWNTQSLLGESFTLRSKYIEAEALLVEAAEQIEPPETSMNRRDEAIQRVVDLYTAWHAAEPRNGYDALAEEWGSRLEQSD